MEARRATVSRYASIEEQMEISAVESDNSFIKVNSEKGTTILVSKDETENKVPEELNRK